MDEYEENHKAVLEMCRDVSIRLWEQYNSFIAAGFNENQAMKLTIEYMRMNYSLAALLEYQKVNMDVQQVLKDGKRKERTKQSSTTQKSDKEGNDI
jgi:hypothetical protein